MSFLRRHRIYTGTGEKRGVENAKTQSDGLDVPKPSKVTLLGVSRGPQRGVPRGHRRVRRWRPSGGPFWRSRQENRHVLDQKGGKKVKKGQKGVKSREIRRFWGLTSQNTQILWKKREKTLKRGHFGAFWGQFWAPLRPARWGLRAKPP